jgi:competence protein ComEA
MKYRSIALILIASSLLAGGAAFAADAAKPAADQPAAAAPTTTGKSKADATKSDGSKTKAKAKKPKPIDINNASAADLKKIPGISDAEAERIIKNRPYLTRSHLVTKDVLTLDQYYAMKDYMIAVQPDPNASKGSKPAPKK